MGKIKFLKEMITYMPKNPRKSIIDFLGFSFYLPDNSL